MDPVFECALFSTAVCFMRSFIVPFTPAMGRKSMNSLPRVFRSIEKSSI